MTFNRRKVAVIFLLSVTMAAMVLSQSGCRRAEKTEAANSSTAQSSPAPENSQEEQSMKPRCATVAPPPAQRATIEEALLSKRESYRELRPEGSVVIPVYFHILRSTDGSKGTISEEAARRQVDVLNRAFSGKDPAATGSTAKTAFRFQYSGIETTDNDAWFDMYYEEDPTEAEQDAKEYLNQGDSSTLNIYTANLIDKPFGWARWPWELHKKVDGIVIGYKTLPGGGQYHYDEGDTATHEVGHWLGLYHTFENGCLGLGDHVEDTPYEGLAATGCPSSRNSCPAEWGHDPLQNFMNYTWDSCMYEFTPGQSERMDQMHRMYRS
jgi:hypothetical protein